MKTSLSLLPAPRSPLPWLLGLLLALLPASGAGLFFSQNGLIEAITPPEPIIPGPPTTSATLLAYWIGDSESAGAVSTWTDSSGNGRHLTQGTTAKRPVATTGLLNGRTGIVFDGVDDFLDVSGFYPFDTSYIIFAVVRPTLVNGNWRTILIQGHPTINGRRPVFLGLNGGFGAPLNSLSMFWNQSIGNTYAAVGGAAAVVNTGYYLSVGRTNSTPSYWRNGTAGTATGATFETNSADPVRVGLYQDGTGYPWTGEIYAILIYDAMMSTSDRESVEAWLASPEMFDL